MSETTHHAIIVTSGLPHAIFTAAQKAREIFGEKQIYLTPPGVNGVRSFLVPPDGSKDGWSDSDEGDRRRMIFLRWIQDAEIAYALEWVEIEYGDPIANRGSVTRQG